MVEPNFLISLRSIINESIETINISCLSNREKIDIIKTVLPFILSKRKSEDLEIDESNREFVIEILKSEYIPGSHLEFGT